MTITDYLHSIERALSYNRQTWFPMEREDRRDMNLRLAREIGYGLGTYDDWHNHVSATYSTLVVRNSFDSVGVAIDSSEWVDAMQAGVEKCKAYTQERG